MATLLDVDLYSGRGSFFFSGAAIETAAEAAETCAEACAVEEAVVIFAFWRVDCGKNEGRNKAQM